MSKRTCLREGCDNLVEPAAYNPKGKKLYCSYSCKTRVSAAKATTRRRRRIYDSYGGQCQECGVECFDDFELDHVFGNGCDHRAELGIESRYLYSYMIAQGCPNCLPYLLQVLCIRCHDVKSRRFHERSRRLLSNMLVAQARLGISEPNNGSDEYVE